MKKRIIIKKYIMANSITEALRIEKTTKPEDVWIDDDWRKLNDDFIKKEWGYK